MDKSGDIKYQVIMIDKVTSVDEKYFDKYYLPIVGRKAKDIYFELIKKIEDGKHDTDLLNHYLLSTELELSDEEYKENRHKLEAVGLLRTYFNQNKMFYEIHAPLRPSEFFNTNNIALLTILEQSIGCEACNNLHNELTTTKYSYRGYQDISSSLDDIYQSKNRIVDKYDLWWNALRSATPRIKRNYFDYEVIVNELEQKQVLDELELRSNRFYDLVNNVSFCFQLSTEEMRKCLLESINESNKTLKEKTFIDNVKKIYTLKNNGEEPTLFVKTNPQLNNETIKKLDKISTNMLVKSRYNTTLTAKEVAMVETLTRVDKYPLGFMNVLMIYVMEHNNKEIPSINYFRKIGNTWIRQGVKSTKDALEKLNSPLENKVYQSKRREASVPSWVDDYIKQTKTEPARDNNELDVIDINELFTRKEK